MSIQFHILQLELAWEQKSKDQTNEMKAYENICMSYYYLGDIKSSKYYMERVINGEFEPDGSVVKRIASTMVKNSREKMRGQGYRHLIEEYERASRRTDFRLSKAKISGKSSIGILSGIGMGLGSEGINKSSSQMQISSPLGEESGNGVDGEGRKKSLLFSPVIPLGKRQRMNFSFTKESKKPKTQYLRGASRITNWRYRARPVGKTNPKTTISNIFSSSTSLNRSGVVNKSNLHTEKGFKNMIKGVLLRRGRSTSNKHQKYYTHQSHLRNIQGIVTRSVIEGIKETLEKFLKTLKSHLPKQPPKPEKFRRKPTTKFVLPQ